MSTDEKFIRRCLELGEVARRSVDAPVGSVIVLEGRVVAGAVESVKLKNDPTAHAEIVAVREACRGLATLDLSGGTIYTNVEPCWMCSYAIRRARLGRVCYGSRNERVGGASSRYAVLLDAGFGSPAPEVVAGILAEECDALLSSR